MKKRVAITLHGIRTRGKWQKDLTPIFASYDIIPYPLDFGRFGALGLLCKGCRAEKLDWFCKEYDNVKKQTGVARPSIVAHSFGSYIACHLLRSFPGIIVFDKVILAGSIVPADFDWDTILERGYVSQVRNEVASLDPWPGRAKRFVGGAGQSGSKGFSGFSSKKSGRCVEYYHDTGHSGTHFDGMYEDWARFVACPKFLSKPDTKEICDLLGYAVQRTADLLGADMNSIRANILLPRTDATLQIPEGAHFNMKHPPERDISIPIGRGISGVAFARRKNVAFVQSGGSWGQYALPHEELAKVDPSLEWVLAFPLVDDASGRVFGVMNVDGTSRVDGLTDPSDHKAHAAITELLNLHVPVMARQLCQLETGGF